MKKILTINEILEYYDIPQLLSAKDTDGLNYICLCYDIDDNGDLNYISAQISQYQMDSFLNGDMELSYLFRFAEQRCNLYSAMLSNDDTLMAVPFKGRLTVKMLPTKPYYCNISDALQPA